MVVIKTKIGNVEELSVDGKTYVWKGSNYRSQDGTFLKEDQILAAMNLNG